MNKFKRTLTLALALIICVSFCTLNGNATWHDFQSPTTTIYFDPNETDAYAEVHITDWAEVTNTTDLYAETYAIVGEYEELYGELFVSLAVEVCLAVELEDGSSYERTDYKLYDPSMENTELLAHLDGEWYLNEDDHYSIAFFEAEHVLYIDRYTHWTPVTWVPTNLIADDTTIFIGFTS